jgi:transcriptional regulator with XRE-family HTH domain
MKPGRPANLQRRRKKFFKQGEFADLLGITFEHLSRVETGKAIFSSGIRKLAEAILTLKETNDEKEVIKILLDTRIEV